MPIGTRRITRRSALKLPLLGAAATALPAITGRAAERLLRYVPYSNLIVMDPVWSISIIGLEHAFMTCDQLYGLDESYTPQPQMAAGHDLSDDKRRWRITLRDGLVFHDGEKVRAADCVASIARWAKRDPFGQRMAALLDEMRAGGRQEFRNPPEAALCASAVRPGRHHLLHPPRTPGEDRYRQGDHRPDRQRTVPLPGRRVRLRRPRRLRTARRLCAAPGNAVVLGRRQAGVFRPGRMEVHSRSRRPPPPRCKPAKSIGSSARCWTWSPN